MKQKVDLDAVYAPSEDVVARDIHGEFIIIPITSGVGDMENTIFALNESGRTVWRKMDGKKTLREVAIGLAKEYSASRGEIEKDVLGLSQELMKRKMIVKID